MLSPQFMRKYRRHAVVTILIVAAIITPPDPLSQTLISLPLYILYEISIIISAVVVRNKRKQDLEDEKAETATA
jgi:sec-independent protein translocase protein TatC